MKKGLLFFTLFYLIFLQHVWGENNKMKIFFTNDVEKNKWIFFTDGVMGGVSNGQMEFINEDENNFLRLRGDVSTDNNGGFIQARYDISNMDSNIKDINLSVRGNNEYYHLFIRTKQTLLPWQFYSAKFFAKDEWSNVTLKIEDFEKSGFLLSSKIKTNQIKSIGIVAYGRDFEAFIDVKFVGFNK